ncbi:BRISC and BRCA1-A complex member 2-like [Hibiscus syriacus]|uniref:BRISC and BRCA1-A complex member 2-like n=1 Tax=Hibiscus syriacus TaxID=106335 RepID=UPI0019221B13|nr:BRISC and BRCA1-A complex member 2-like [Hibiscus syriacus]
MPLDLSLARGGQICCASHGYEHKQNGAWMPLETSTKDLLTGNIPVGKKNASTLLPARLKLMSTTELRALFSIEDVKLPSCLDAMCMAEYLPHLEEYLPHLEESLQKQFVLLVVEAFPLIHIRRHFIESLAPLFGKPLEADPLFCRKATFLASSGSFVFLVHFFISTQFPKQQPALMLQSSQHISPQGIPKKSPLLSEYPWSPRWEASRMAVQIFDFLADEALNFKWFCNESQPQH